MRASVYKQEKEAIKTHQAPSWKESSIDKCQKQPTNATATVTP